MRFTPAVKYGGRENWPSRRETRCIRYHPCRAHHKLKWARKVQSIVMLLYEHLSLSESDKDSTQFAHGLSKGVRQPYQPSIVKPPTSNGRHKRTQSPAVTAPGTQCPALQRGNRIIQGGHWGNSQSPLPSLAAGGTKNKGKNKRLSFKKPTRKKESKA